MAQLALTPLRKETSRVHTRINTSYKRKIEALSKAHGVDENHIINSLVAMSLEAIAGTKEINSRKK